MKEVIDFAMSIILGVVIGVLLSISITAFTADSGKLVVQEHYKYIRVRTADMQNGR